MSLDPPHLPSEGLNMALRPRPVDFSESIQMVLLLAAVAEKFYKTLPGNKNLDRFMLGVWNS